MIPQNIIQDIRKRCRLAMNGIASTSMRVKGLNYKLNFGLSLQKIKEISQHYQANSNLANLLWKEDVRELKILATLLYPINEFDHEIANQWIKEIPNQEIREQICINLLQNTDFANTLVKSCTNNESENIRATGYWLLVRLAIQKKNEPDYEVSYYIYILEDILSGNFSLRNAALLALKRIGRTSANTAKYILALVEKYKDSDNLLESEVYNSLRFEFEYYID